MCILQHNAQRTAQIRFLYLVDIDTVVTDFAILYIIKAVNQIGNRRFARTRASYKGNFLPRRRKYFDIVRTIFLSS